MSDLARWDDMTAAERDALVAVHVMGYRLKCNPSNFIVTWYYKDAQMVRRDYWRPTTDRNDCAEAVRALRLSGKQEKSLNTKISRLIGYADGPLFYYLVDPADVCRAMLEALAGR